MVGFTECCKVCIKAGYSVWSAQAEIRHQGGVAVAWRDKAGWKVEGISNYGPNVVILFLTTGLRRWYIVG